MPNGISDDIVSEAMERASESEYATSHNRNDYELWYRFARLGEQWAAPELRKRTQDNRPALTINLQNRFIRQIVNEGRARRPAIQVGPVDGDADEDTALVYADLIRAIERESRARDAYDTALDCAASGGFGFFGIDLEYERPDSFDMRAVIYRISNPLSVHWDHTTEELDSSDWEFCLRSDWIPKEAFKKRFPNVEIVEFPMPNGENDAFNSQWYGDEKVRIAEYWKRTMERRKILLLSDGNVVEESRIEEPVTVAPDGAPISIQGLLNIGMLEVARERTAEFPRVQRYMINGAERLEERDWPGQHIPIIPVWGEEVIVDGLRHLRSAIADNLDSQRFYNIHRTATAEILAQAPKQRFIADERGVRKFKRHWDNMGTRNDPYLPYDFVAADGNPPIPIPPPQAAVADAQAAVQADEEQKEVTSIYNASLGAPSNERSGRAISQRQQQSERASYHFLSNQERAIVWAGTILTEIIPRVYGQRQVIRVLGENKRERVVRLSEQAPGEGRVFDLNSGKYDVAIRAGAAFATSREETRNSLFELLQAQPDLAPMVLDVLLDNLDFEGADVIARRMKLALPPQIQLAEAPEIENMTIDEARAAVAQLMNVVQQLQQQNQQLSSEQAVEAGYLQAQNRGIDAKLQASREDNQTKLAIAELKAVTDSIKG